MAKANTLVTFQQAELNAVMLYKGLAEKMQDDADKQLLLSIAADEGRHAAILRKITGKTLKPRASLKNMILMTYKVCGKKGTFAILSKSEKSAAKLYEPFFAQFPETKEIAEDESRHGSLLKGV